MQFTPQKPVPIFPLPDFVLFPGIVTPLHVFELRYRTMVREALSAERIIALALLKPGWERDYHGSPEFFPLACLARFQEVEWLPNDCYDLKLIGLSRVRLGSIVREYPYRAAKVHLLTQEPYTEDDPLVEMEKCALAETFGRWSANASREEPGATLDLERRYEILVNSVCMVADLAPREKLELLEVDSILERGHRVREALEKSLLRPRPRMEPGGEHN